ncbi:MAG: hypothetical protein KGD73_09960 [Candidatus Lokiarchaeota archaeon]|nr:hypothetical protein [Candidatus Lokiarchaeota archaeon]
MSLGLSFYLNLVASIGGIFFFIYSLILIRKIKKLFPKGEVTKKWFLRELLIVIFLFGYIFNIIFNFFELTELITYMTAFVYLFGGVFVFIIIRLVQKTYVVILKESTNK